MPDTEYLAAQRPKPTTERDIEALQRSAAHRFRIMAFGHQNRGDAIRITIRVHAEKLRPGIARPMAHATPHRFRKARVARENLIQAFFFQQAQAFLQAIEEGSGHSSDKGFMLARQHIRPGQV